MIRNFKKYAWIYVFLSAFSIVLIDKNAALHPKVSVSLLLMCGSLTAIIFFNILSYKNFTLNHISIKSDFINYMKISLYLCLCWAATYIGAIYSSATFLIFVLFLTNAILGSIASRLFGISWITFLILSTGIAFNMSYGYIAIISSVLSGVFAFLYYFNSEKYAKKNHLSALDLMSIRFYGLFLGSSIFVIFQCTSIDLNTIPILITLGFLNMVIPSYFAQKSVIVEGITSYAQVAAMMPLITEIFQLIVFNKLDYTLLFLSILASCFLLLRSKWKK